MSPDSPDKPSSFRRELREQALDVVTRQLADVGWDQIRFGNVAAAVGVSRPTLYAEFGNKDGFGEALVAHEAQRFLQGIAEVLGDPTLAPLTAVKYATAYTFDEAERSPVVRAILTSRTVDGRTSDTLLPFITTRAAPIMRQANGGLVGWLSEVCPDTSEQEIDDAVDVIVRLVVSYLLAPVGDDEEMTARVCRLVERLLPQIRSAATLTNA